MELAARLAVLLACGAAGAALFILLAAPGRARARRPEPGPPAGLVSAVLATFILLAGGTVLTGAGTIDAGSASDVARAAGIGLLAVASLPAARSVLRVLSAPTAAEAARVLEALHALDERTLAIVERLAASGDAAAAAEGIPPRP